MEVDPITQKQAERSSRVQAQALVLQAERRLKEVVLDFGMQFAQNRRQHIENLSEEMRDSLT